MLASVTGVPLSAIRRWERRGYLQPQFERQRLSCFDFSEVTVAQRLAEVLSVAGSLASVDRLVDGLKRAYPEVERPLMTTPLVVEAGKIFVRDGETLAEPGGQLLIDFDTDTEEMPSILSIGRSAADDDRDAAMDLHDGGAIEEAIETLRLAMLRTSASADDHFTLGEWLYEAGQREAARERFYASLELDAEHVEARVNLACLLAEQGQTELAVAAFRGTLESHPFYTDAHFHLAVTLQRAGQSEAANEHYRRFLEIAPESPWAEQARVELKESVAP